MVLIWMQALNRPGAIGYNRRAVILSALMLTGVLSGVIETGALSTGEAAVPAKASESLESLVNRGNVAADQQHYPAAIQAYEQAIQKAPAAPNLKNNLAILYANQAVSLQEQKKYEPAFQALEKGLRLVSPESPTARSLREAKGSLYFSQAIDLKDGNQTPSPSDIAAVKALLEKAIALNPKEAVFKKAMAGVYMDEAYTLAVEERYADAKPLLDEALIYDPQNKAVTQSLANVYLGLAKNQPSQREEWIDKATTLDKSSAMRQKADRILALGRSTPVENKTALFAANPSEAKMIPPREMAKLSVSDMLRDMEAQLQLTPGQDDSLNARLEVLEKQVLGKAQEGGLAVRTKLVYTSLMGRYDGAVSTQSPHLIASTTASDDGYLDEIFKVTDGKVIRWGKFPLRIYFETPKDNPLFRTQYKDAALEGFNLWKSQTQGFVNFVEVKNPQAADIQVSWIDTYEDRFENPDHLPTVYRDYKAPKKSPLMGVVQVATMLTPGYFSLAPQMVGAAMQYKQAKKMQILVDESKIKLGLLPTRDLGDEAAGLLMRNMAAKEFGHVLGLKGSSTQTGDLLYPGLRSDAPQSLSTRDLATLRELYNRPPNIILNTH